MANRNYNPLNKGYSGKSLKKKGYTGSETTNTNTAAPGIITNIQSGVVKPINSIKRVCVTW